MVKPSLIVLLAVALVYFAYSLPAQRQDIGPFNTFATAYNAYVMVDPRIDDRKALKRLLHEWHTLEKSQGWKTCEVVAEQPTSSQ